MSETWKEPIISKELVVHGGMSSAPIVVDPTHIMELGVKSERKTFVTMQKQENVFQDHQG